MKLVQPDHRRFSRNRPPQEIAASLIVGGRSYPTSVVDYSLRGVGLRVGSSAVQRAQRGESDVELELQDRKYLGRIQHHRTERFESIVGVDLKNDTAQGPISFTSEDPGWDLIDNPETLETLFGDLVLKGPECPVEVRQLRGEGTILAQKIENSKLTAGIFSTKRGRLETGTASFRFEIFQTCHAFDAKIIPVNGNQIEVELPKKVARLLRRETFRVKNGANEKWLKVEIRSELLGKPTGELKLYDYAEHGLSVIDPSGWLAAPIGFKLDDITITTADGTKVQGRGIIRGYRWLPEENQYTIGIGFETASDNDRTNWHNAILHVRYPTLSFEYQPEDHQEIWELFDRSGYLDIGDREAFSHVLDLTKMTWEKLRDAGTKFSKRAMIKIEDKIVGHLQMDRIYPETWVAHHLAIDPKVSKVVGKDLYSVTTDVLSAEGAKCILSITEAEKPWNQRNYFDFVKQYRFPAHNEIRIMRLYEIQLSDPIELGRHPQLSLRIANQYDLRRIARFFELYGSNLERKALALDYENLDLSKFNEELKPVGLNRGREFVVGTIDGQMVGFAQIETGTLGINLFNLVDMLYIQVVPDLGSQSELVHETLLGAGIARFRDIGRKRVPALLDDKRSEYYAARGLKYVWDGARWIGLCVAARRYQAFSQMLYGHLILRQGQIRKHRAPSLGARSDGRSYLGARP